MGPVAGAAKKGEPCRKAQKNLARRLKDFAQVKDTRNGGYHQPGSMQRN
jgi:hypothetical protein